MSDQDCRTSRVSLAVYEETKQDWEDAVQTDPNADSLSQLIRVAVNRASKIDITISQEEPILEEYPSKDRRDVN